jgi:proliferating cell nuclear antigen
MSKILELKTVQTNSFKVLIEALKEILTDANITFDSTGLKIVAMDPSQTVLVHLKLEASKFEYYKCDKRLVIGVSMINFFKLIKTMTNNDSLTLFITDENTNILNIKMENCDKNRRTVFNLNLMDLNEDNFQIPSQSFESIITMPSQDFQKICRDMHNLSDTIEIKSVGQQLIFSCNGDFASQETIHGETQSGISFLKSNNNEVIQGYYNLKHLVLFTKCTNLCNSIELYMKNDFPIVIQFIVGSLGTLKLALAPQHNMN